MHDAEDGMVALHQRDVDRELAVPAQELLGAVERVHQPEPGRRRARQSLALGALLGNHRNARRPRAQDLDDDRLRALVGAGDRRVVGLAPHIGRANGVVDLEDGDAGALRRVAREIEERGDLAGAHATGCSTRPSLRAVADSVERWKRAAGLMG